jgi:hypothetical protein
MRRRSALLVTAVAVTSLVAGSSAHANPGSGQLCESTHVGTDQAGASTHGDPVIYSPPSVISYESPSGVSVYLCSEFVWDDGRVEYWDDSNDPTIPGHWTQDENAACTLAVDVRDGGRTRRVLGAIG